MATLHRPPVVVAGLLLAALAWPRPARAYRPFDQTDAGVAPPRTFELELGPLAFASAPQDGPSRRRFIYLPGFVLNYGVVDRLELVLDARQAFLFGGPNAAAERRTLDTGWLAKVVLRRGSLQDGTGPSIATEIGPRLPSLPVAGQIGASAALIVSQRGHAGTIHLNVEGELTRDHQPALTAGTILEAPAAWTVRPVAEILVARERGTPASVAALAGGIWQALPALSCDAAARVSSQDGRRATEVRAGLTWTVGP